ncbi:MAG: glycosyl hydrolase [Candidatus Eremiobacteraeota bacterium]|nr:glycosyl hydrolase [Candidatus Eremiobacteraeota bacterium]
MKRLIAVAFSLSFFAATAVAVAAPKPPAQVLMSKLAWRSIGPYIGGRVVAVAGVPSNPDLFYMGGVQGGVWKSTDYGQNWTNITDGQIPGIADPIGTLAVADSKPNVIYAGTGESDIRGDFDTGDGIYKSTNAGKTWSYAGLRDTHMTTDLAIDPRDANVVYAASMGHVFKPNPERGVFKTTDGGKTWRKVLFVDDNTGGVALSMDKRHPATLYAAMWQAQRVPWKLTSGGPGSGLYKTTDGGAHWAKISSNPGYATGTLGKIGVSIAQSDPRVVYSIVQAKDGGVFRSENGGKTWTRTNSDWKLRQRAFYYTAIFADPTNPKRAYAPNVDSLYVTSDGGKVWKTVDGIPHGDHHIVWINPRHPKILLEGNDGGATVSVNGGDTWSTVDNQPTGQIYHVALDHQFPFHIFGASQDEGAWEYASASNSGGITPASWFNVALGESTFIAPDPDDPYVTYGSGYYSSFVRYNRQTGQEESVSPWPRYKSGTSSAEAKYRFGWTHPIMFSPANPHELLVAAQVLFSSTDRGQTWSVLSPDLTRNDPRTEGPSGGPVFNDQTGAETFPDIHSLAVSPLDGDVMWTGSSDGLVHVTKDHGAHWTAVTPPQLPQWAEISSIEASHVEKGTAYLSASRYMYDDYHPYVYKTTDYGAHWSAIANGLPSDQYVFAVRQDPREPQLLFTGTRSTAYVSLDGGSQWLPLALGLPGVQVRDLAIDAREGEVVAATHGRAFWILDNLALLEALARQNTYSVSTAQLFAPETAWLTQSYGGGNSSQGIGENPRYGARIFFNLPANYNGNRPLTLSFVDAKGATIQSFSLHPAAKKIAKLTEDQTNATDAAHLRARGLTTATGVKPGMNAFQWNMRYPSAFDVPYYNNDVTDDFADSADGPTTLPGAYTVVLQYGSQKLEAPLTISLDPRVHPAVGDLEARLALEKQILATIDHLDHSIDAATATAQHLSPAQRAQVNAEVANLVLLHGSSSEYDVVYPTKLREQLAFLLNSLEGAYTKPTLANAATYQELRAEAADGEAKLASLTSH